MLVLAIELLTSPLYFCCYSLHFAFTLKSMSSLNNHQSHETLIPLINICRKLEAILACSTIKDKHSLEWINKFPNIFNDHNEDALWIKIIKGGLVRYHSSIPPNIWHELISSSPNEKQLKINDSITKSDIPKEEDEDKEQNAEPTNLLNLPNDLKISTFNFLNTSNLYSVQKTCRCLNIAARDPNSLYYLNCADCEEDPDSYYQGDINDNNTEYFSKYLKYLHPWFSRIKCIKFESNLFVNLLVGNKINQNTLKCLELTHCALDNDVLLGMSKLINLEKIILFNVHASIELNQDIVILNQFKNLNYLKLIDIEQEMNGVIRWILTNNQCKKTVFFSITPHYESSQSQLFTKQNKTSLSALTNIKEIIIKIPYYYATEAKYRLFFDNLCESLQEINRVETKTFNLSKFNVTLQSKYPSSYHLSNKLLSSIQSVVPFCDSSSLSADVKVYDTANVEEFDANKWISDLIASKNTFNTMEFKFIFFWFDQRAMNDFLYYSKWKEEDALDVLGDKGKECGRKIMEGYDKYFKPFLKINKGIMNKIGLKCIDIKFDTSYIMDTEEDVELAASWDNIISLFQEYIVERKGSFDTIEMTNQSCSIQFKL